MVEEVLDPDEEVDVLEVDCAELLFLLIEFDLLVSDVPEEPLPFVDVFAVFSS